MSTFYETLGIDKTASADEVKRAYRKKAKDAHPDKGGSAERMAAVNEANDVLSDPERRARYDATGYGTAAKPVDEEARELLMSFVNVALNTHAEGDWITQVATMLNANITGAGLVIADATRRIGKLEAAVGRVKIKAGENLVGKLMNEQIEMQRQRIALAERSMSATEMAGTMLAAYEVEPLPMLAPMMATEPETMQ